MKFGVYLPPCYGPDKPCPVVFFLQGLTCTEQNFIIKSGAQRYASQLGLILVNPDTSPRKFIPFIPFLSQVTIPLFIDTL